MRVSKDEAAPSFETPASRAPQDKGGKKADKKPLDYNPNPYNPILVPSDEGRCHEAS